jgi:hypothetical protein
VGGHGWGIWYSSLFQTLRHRLSADNRNLFHPHLRPTVCGLRSGNASLQAEQFGDYRLSAEFLGRALALDPDNLEARSNSEGGRKEAQMRRVRNSETEAHHNNPQESRLPL